MTWYLERVRWCLAHRWTTLGVASAAIGSMLGLFPFLSTAFSPAGDNGFTTLSVELAPGASLEDTLEAAETARLRLDALPEVRSVYTTVGAQGGGNGSDGRRLGGQRAPRLARDPARQPRRHARGAADLRAQGHRHAARHSGRSVPVRRRWRRQPAPSHAGRRRAESPESCGGQRRARDSRDAGPRHDHEQRRAAEARDRHSAASPSAPRSSV